MVASTRLSLDATSTYAGSLRMVASTRLSLDPTFAYAWLSLHAASVACSCRQLLLAVFTHVRSLLNEVVGCGTTASV
ncbi:hypothetical protein GW17_00004940 [Ensete ventricosum]|nr:hypothetical protein GW17_00004940 [Ensete ventricosum]